MAHFAKEGTFSAVDALGEVGIDDVVDTDQVAVDAEQVADTGAVGEEAFAGIAAA